MQAVLARLQVQREDFLVELAVPANPAALDKLAVEPDLQPVVVDGLLGRVSGNGVQVWRKMADNGLPPCLMTIER